MRAPVLTIPVLAILLAAAPAPAQPAAAPAPAPSPAEAQQADRALLYRLVRQVRRIDRDTEKLIDQAVAEARDNEGRANPETKAKLLSLRDERDRAFSRMLILSMRHGWEIPDLDKPTVERSSRREAEQSVFGAADELVRRRFTAEALRIAGMVRLPVVSIESAPG